MPPLSMLLALTREAHSYKMRIENDFKREGIEFNFEHVFVVDRIQFK